MRGELFTYSTTAMPRG